LLLLVFIGKISSSIPAFAKDNQNAGANVPYTEYQAEAAETNGNIVKGGRTYRNPASEASERGYVSLSGIGKYVTFTLTKPADALVLRFGIPDSEDGSGRNATLSMYIGGKKETLSLTSKYSWVYGKFPWTNNPKDGKAHHFFDDVRIKLDRIYSAGTKITFKIDKENDADYYMLDCLDAEVAEPTKKQPVNSLSVLDFGATPNDGTDDTEAIVNCINAAVEKKKEVYIPEGEFLITNPAYVKGIMLTKDDTVIRGAGMWHTILKGEKAGFFIKAKNISLYDFSLIGNVDHRNDSEPAAIQLESDMARRAKNIHIENIWMEHWKVGVWASRAEEVHIKGCRIRNTFADGINFSRGTSRSVVEQCDIRNTGDDGIAAWSAALADTDIVFRNNTVSLQWLANNIAVYGGKDIQIKGNLIKDTVAFGSGINISTRFNPQPFAGKIIVSGNRLERCGSYEYDIGKPYGAIWFNTEKGHDNHADVIVQNNQIIDSTYHGILFFNEGLLEHVLLKNNTIDTAGTYGIEAGPKTKGKAVLVYNVIRNTKQGGIHNASGETFTIQASDQQKRVLPEVLAAGSAVLAAGILFILFWKRKNKVKKPMD
jgi:hypothetical protein